MMDVSGSDVDRLGQRRSMEKNEENPSGSREHHLHVIAIFFASLMVSQSFRFDSFHRWTEQWFANRFYEQHLPSSATQCYNGNFR
jgi:hypothetical protein